MHIKFLTTPLLAALLLIPTLLNAQDRFPGVNDLSRRQIEALNTWLIRYTANEAPVLQAENKEVIEVVNQGLTSQIVGEFNGWSGKTRLVLENGQVFEHRRSSPKSIDTVQHQQY